MSSLPNEPTLFDVAEQALPKALPEPSPGPAVPFDVALLALGSIRGLGSKGLKRLVGAYKDDLGRFLAHPRKQMAEELETRKVAGAQKLAEAIAKDVPGLLNTAEASRQELAR